MKTFKRIFKYIALFLLVILVGIIIYFYQMSAIKSDEKILNNIANLNHEFNLFHAEYQDVKYRYVVTKNFDSSNPTLTMIHGAIGAIDTFEKYTQSIPSNDMNLLVLDRPNYGNDFNENYEHSIAFEALLVNDLSAQYWSKKNNNILGYSYGGPIALFAHAMRPYDNVFLVSPAIDPENEVVPLPIYFYKWRLTRPLVPKVWVEASKEKLSHVKDLEQYVELWKTIRGNIIHIHGDNDIIVPYENVNFLESLINPNSYQSITIDGGGHGSLWGEYKFIKNLIEEQIF